MSSRQAVLDEILAKLECADLADVRKCYRKKVLLVHPDKPTGSPEAFQEVQEAYELLTDPAALEDHIAARLAESGEDHEDPYETSSQSSVATGTTGATGAAEPDNCDRALYRLARYFMFPPNMSKTKIEQRLEIMLAKTMEMYHTHMTVATVTLYDRMEIPCFQESLRYIAWIRKVWDVTRDVRYENFIQFTSVVIMIRDLEKALFCPNPPSDYSGMLLELEEAYISL